MNFSFVQLSVDIQVLAVSGALGYFIAFSGYRRNHEIFEQVVYVFLFAAPAAVFLNEVGAALWAYAVSIFIGLLFGVLWRWTSPWVRRLATDRLRIPLDDAAPDAWQSMLSGRLHPVTQITVVLKDGSVLHCDRVSDFRDSPDGPCILGYDGSLMLYVTHKSADGVQFEPFEGVRSDDFGDEMTFIPSDQIARVTLRRAIF